MQTETTYTLDKKKLGDALAILDTELEALKSCAQIAREMNTGWPRVINNVFIAGIIVIGIPFNHRWISAVVALISGAVLYAVILLSALFSGFRSIRAFRRLRRTQRNLGVDRIGWLVGWKEFGARLLRLLPAYLGMLVCAVSISYRYVHIWILDVGLVSFALGLMTSTHLLASRMVLPFQKRMEENERLRLRLMSSQNGAGLGEDQMISIPEMEYKQIVRIERAQVVLDRQQTIKESSKMSDLFVWSVQKSASILKKKSTLESSVWFRVEMRIDELSTNPQPADARKDADGIWWVAVPETSYEISYTLAEDPRRIMVHDLFKKAEIEREDREVDSA